MTCDECNFYQPVSTTMCLPRSQRFGECRRKPPRVVDAPSHREHQTLAVFPVVSENDWCGEFVEWPAPLGQRATHVANAALDAAALEDATHGPLAADAGEGDRLPERSPTSAA
ncbi:hypothetical protein SH528x_003303 [Novipirellula sp. SH528]|uniref:hypothetical protein n=1 Tax=Novipirellula sp. SH528 TaxID=3454466 RepID=UPI003F9F0B9C